MTENQSGRSNEKRKKKKKTKKNKKKKKTKKKKTKKIPNRSCRKDPVSVCEIRIGDTEVTPQGTALYMVGCVARDIESRPGSGGNGGGGDRRLSPGVCALQTTGRAARAIELRPGVGDRERAPRRTALCTVSRVARGIESKHEKEKGRGGTGGCPLGTVHCTQQAVLHLASSYARGLGTENARL